MVSKGNNLTNELFWLFITLFLEPATYYITLFTMKQTLLISIPCTLFCMLFFYYDNKQKRNDLSLIANVEALTSMEFPQNICYNGGPGASSCSIDSGIDVFGFGISRSCDVECRNGYYACCGLRCTCEKESWDEKFFLLFYNSDFSFPRLYLPRRSQW